MLTFAQVDAAVRVVCHQADGQPLPFLDGMRRYLVTKERERISDGALARIAAQYGKSRDGYAEEVVALVAEEQERRRQAAAALIQQTADKALTWAVRNAAITAFAALAAVVAAWASIAALHR